MMYFIADNIMIFIGLIYIAYFAINRFTVKYTENIVDKYVELLRVRKTKV